VVASIVNLFLQSAALYWIVTYAGILIFVGLIASDTQKIKRLSQQATDDSSVRRIAILGSLMLYLDFINLFLLLLRIFGGRRD
jgi:FtsH-binding integral membrane protein